MVCWDIYSKEKASKKWRRTASSDKASKERKKQSLFSRVFWPSFFYLLAFCLTWPPYLGLQYAWAGGSSFTNYGLILTPATLVPLQGFWNMPVYIKPRYGNQIAESVRRAVTRFRGSSLPTRSTTKKTSNTSGNNGSGDMLPLDGSTNQRRLKTSQMRAPAALPDLRLKEMRKKRSKKSWGCHDLQCSNQMSGF